MLTRRAFVNALAATAATAALAGCGTAEPELEPESEPVAPESSEPAATPISSATVYLTRDISPAGLRRAFDALGFSPAGNVAVKLSTGEPGGHNFLSPNLIGELVRGIGATIVECNTAYGGARGTTESHLRAASDHGFTAIADVDIMDADGSMSLPVTGGAHLTEDLVGAHLASYDSVVSLAHFKGHAMGGFGGAMAYVNVMNRLSVDCDCDSHPAEPEMADIGILASLDPVALDRACVDLVYAAHDGVALVERIESRNGVHTLDHAEAIGLGGQTYELVDLDAETTEGEAMTINVTCNGQTVTYELNDSLAARALYEQLPLTCDVESFGSNEQTFYPPEALDCSDAPLAEGGAGVLAYYEPWGDV